MSSPDTRRVLPAYRIYYDWEDTKTNPDARLSSGFEDTNPGVTFEDEATWVDWAVPALVLLVGGFFIGKWWAGRKPTGATAVGETESSGLDLLGVN
jgi:hypothetical protein